MFIIILLTPVEKSTVYTKTTKVVTKLRFSLGSSSCYNVRNRLDWDALFHSLSLIPVTRALTSVLKLDSGCPSNIYVAVKDWELLNVS